MEPLRVLFISLDTYTANSLTYLQIVQVGSSVDHPDVGDAVAAGRLPGGDRHPLPSTAGEQTHHLCQSGRSPAASDMYRLDEGVVGSGMGLYLIVDNWLKILPQNSKGAS